MKSIIYKITNLINNKVYIGQFRRRDASAFNNYWGSGKIIKKAIKKYGLKNFKKEIIVEGRFNKCLTNQLEIHYIRVYNTISPHGYNITEGGHNTAINLERPIHQYDLNGNFIKTWDSAESAKKELNVSNLSAVVHGRQKTSGGFIWTRDKRNIRTKVEKANNVIKKYEHIFWIYKNKWKKWKSVKDASEYYDISKTQLHNILSNRRSNKWLKGCFISKKRIKNIPKYKTYAERNFKPIVKVFKTTGLEYTYNSKKNIIKDGHSWPKVLKCLKNPKATHHNNFWYVGDKPKEIVINKPTLFVFHNSKWNEFFTIQQIVNSYKISFSTASSLTKKSGWHNDLFITTDKETFFERPVIKEFDINQNCVTNVYFKMKEICQKYKIPSSTLSRYIKNNKPYGNLRFIKDVQIEIV